MLIGFTTNPEDSIGPPRCRRFTLGDGMILIVAFALWLALARSGLVMLFDAARKIPIARLLTWEDWQVYLFGTPAWGAAFLTFGNALLLGSFTFLHPAFVILRLRRPRPPLRALIRQPGFAGCAAPMVVLLALMVISPVIYFGNIGLWAGVLATPLTWILLTVTRSWAPEPGWIDRLGWNIAILWVISAMLFLLVPVTVPM